MLKVGITGGIGSGKSTVCQVFEILGIPVFYADRAAELITNTHIDVVSGITELFGEGIYMEGKLDRTKVGSLVFADPTLLSKMNAIVHPATIAYASEWMQQQSAPYAIKEAAIFFESGSYKAMDIMVGVSAPIDVRIRRTIARDGITSEKVLERISRQMDEEEKMKRCDYVIVNDDTTAIIPQVLQLHREFIGRTG